METQTERALQTLELLLRDQLLTPTKTVDNDTLVCLTEMLPDGNIRYHQMYFTAMPAMLQASFFGKSKNERVGPYKLVALFDIWDFDVTSITI